MNTDYRFEFILNNNDGAFIYYENLLTGKLERTNYDRRIMDWLLNTNIEHGRETRLYPHCLYLWEIIRTKTTIDLGEDLEEMKRKNKGEWPED